MNFIKKLFSRKSENQEKLRSETPNDFAENEIKLLEAFCPYCGCQFEKIPTRKRKCPECKETICLMRKEGEDNKFLATEEQFNLSKKQKAWDKILEFHIEIIENFNGLDLIKPIDITDSRKLPIGSRQLTDRLFHTYNQIAFELMKAWNEKGDIYSKGFAEIYFQQARILEFEGKDFRRRLADAWHWEYIERNIDFDSYGLKMQISIRQDELTCDNCKCHDAKMYTLNEWIKEKPLVKHPCTRTNGICFTVDGVVS